MNEDTLVSADRASSDTYRPYRINVTFYRNNNFEEFSKEETRAYESLVNDLEFSVFDAPKGEGVDFGNNLHGRLRLIGPASGVMSKFINEVGAGSVLDISLGYEDDGDEKSSYTFYVIVPSYDVTSSTISIELEVNNYPMIYALMQGKSVARLDTTKYAGEAIREFAKKLNWTTSLEPSLDSVKFINEKIASMSSNDPVDYIQAVLMACLPKNSNASYVCSLVASNANKDKKSNIILSVATVEYSRTTVPSVITYDITEADSDVISFKPHDGSVQAAFLGLGAAGYSLIQDDPGGNKDSSLLRIDVSNQAIAGSADNPVSASAPYGAYMGAPPEIQMIPRLNREAAETRIARRMEFLRNSVMPATLIVRGTNKVKPFQTVHIAHKFIGAEKESFLSGDYQATGISHKVTPEEWTTTIELNRYGVHADSPVVKQAAVPRVLVDNPKSLLDTLFGITSKNNLFLGIYDTNTGRLVTDKPVDNAGKGDGFPGLNAKILLGPTIKTPTNPQGETPDKNALWINVDTSSATTLP